MPTQDEFHALVTDLSTSLARIRDEMNALMQSVTSSEHGNIVDPADLAALHVAVAAAADLAANAVVAPAGDPVPDTGTPVADVPGPSAGPTEAPPVPGSDPAPAPVPAADASLETGANVVPSDPSPQA